MIKHFRHEFEAKINAANLPTSDRPSSVPAGARA
jgi:hypothetical protein